MKFVQVSTLQSVTKKLPTIQNCKISGRQNINELMLSVKLSEITEMVMPF